MHLIQSWKHLLTSDHKSIYWHLINFMKSIYDAFHEFDQFPMVMLKINAQTSSLNQNVAGLWDYFFLLFMYQGKSQGLVVTKKIIHLLALDQFIKTSICKWSIHKSIYWHLIRKASPGNWTISWKASIDAFHEINQLLKVMFLICAQITWLNYFFCVWLSGAIIHLLFSTLFMHQSKCKTLHESIYWHLIRKASTGTWSVSWKASMMLFMKLISCQWWC